MTDGRTFTPVLSSQAAGFLISLTRVKQRKLIALLEMLAENPMQIGDFHEPDDTGREIQFLWIGDLLIGFWADHPVREIRIVRIDEA
jgi:hypothetical protein